MTPEERLKELREERDLLIAAIEEALDLNERNIEIRKRAERDRNGHS